MELQALLELLYSASDRSRTVRATVRGWNHQAREVDLMRARGVYRDPPPIPPEEGSWGEPSDTIETTTRLWAARPYWLRWESTFSSDGMDDRTSVGVKEAELFWQRFGEGEVQTNEGQTARDTMTTDGERLLDPSHMLGVYRFDVGSPRSLLDRRAIEVTAHRRLGAHNRTFGPLDDELCLVVDEERGILLRASVIVEAEELSVRELVEVAFDEPIQPELFRPLR